jgi:hypothetical protein
MVKYNQRLLFLAKNATKVAKGGGNVEKMNIGTKEAAERSGLSIKKIRELCKVPGFPAFLSGKRKILINVAKFDKWLEDKADRRSGFKKS